MADELQKHRERIDALDDEILKLVSERAGHAQAIGVLKNGVVYRPEREAQVLRAKALNPQRGDADLGQEFKMDRSTVYDLLTEHGLQDLHRVLTVIPPTTHKSPTAPETEAEKGGSKSSSAPTP